MARKCPRMSTNVQDGQFVFYDAGHVRLYQVYQLYVSGECYISDYSRLPMSCHVNPMGASLIGLTLSFGEI